MRCVCLLSNSSTASFPVKTAVRHAPNHRITYKRFFICPVAVRAMLPQETGKTRIRATRGGGHGRAEFAIPYVVVAGDHAAPLREKPMLDWRFECRVGAVLVPSVATRFSTSGV